MRLGQSHEAFGPQFAIAFKGHGFSRADFEANAVSALAAEGCIEHFKTIPQGLKPGFLRLSCGTAEAVPFQNKNLLDFQVHAIALGRARAGNRDGLYSIFGALAERPKWNSGEAGDEERGKGTE